MLLDAQLCLTLCDPRDCSLPGSSVHQILQASILEWVVISYRGSFWPRDRTQVSCVAGRFFTKSWLSVMVGLLPSREPLNLFESLSSTISSAQFSSVTQSCLMGLIPDPIPHQLHLSGGLFFLLPPAFLLPSLHFFLLFFSYHFTAYFLDSHDLSPFPFPSILFVLLFLAHWFQSISLWLKLPGRGCLYL